MVVLAGLSLLPGVSVASAQSWQVQTESPIALGNGALRVLWVKPGVTDANGNYSGDTAAVWSVDATGKTTSMGIPYGPIAGWKAEDIAVASDGTTRLEWKIDGSTYNGTGTILGDTVSIWTLDANGKLISSGPVYGPFAGWTEESFAVAPDKTTRLFWTKQGTYDNNGNYNGGTTAVWTLDAAGKEVGTAPVYGPIPGWNADDYEVASDSTGRIFWKHQGKTTANSDNSTSYSGDTIALWTIDAAGKVTSMGAPYGPFTDWYGDSLEVAPDNTTRVLWKYRGTTAANNNYSGDTISLWSFDAKGKLAASGPAYGPYPGWYGVYFQIASDNTARLIWSNPGTYPNNNPDNGTYSGDLVSLWSFDASGKQLSAGPAYGRFAGWYTGFFILAPDNSARLLWTYEGTTDTSNNYSGDTATVWTLDTNGSKTAGGTFYGPYSGWRASFAYPYTNSVTELLWLHDAPGTSTGRYSDDNDEFVLWNLNAVGAQTSAGPVYGPYN